MQQIVKFFMPIQPLGRAEVVPRGRGPRRPQAESGGARAVRPGVSQSKAGSTTFRKADQGTRSSEEDDEELDGDSDDNSGSGNTDISGSDVGDDEQAELDRLREGVKDVPFEIVQKLGALGSARAAENSENSSRRPRGPAHVKRANKNAPQEVSSKIRVGIIPAHTRAAARERRGRDPRFDRLSGKLSEDLFEKSYSWMKQVAQRDAKELRDLASKQKDADARSELHAQAAQIEQKLKQDAKKSEESLLKRARKKAMMEVASSTGKAFWLKKREVCQIEIARKYETLKAKGRGAVDDYSAFLHSPFWLILLQLAKSSAFACLLPHLAASCKKAQAHCAKGPPLHTARAQGRRRRRHIISRVTQMT
jgi:ribosomal RNA-processing protein 36